MLTKIVAKLKTGTIKNVVPFGWPLPTPPYVVVKEEKAPGNMTRFRVIAHTTPGQVITLDAYVKGELGTLLGAFESDDRFTNHFRLEEPDEKDWQGVGASSDDNTISMERSFFAPLLLF